MKLPSAHFAPSLETSSSIRFSWNYSDKLCGDGFAGRLQAIATPLVQNMEKVKIIPPPRDVNERDLTWKGASVLGRMEGVTDLWVTGADWVRQQIEELLLLCSSRYFASSRTRSECGR